MTAVEPGRVVVITGAAGGIGSATVDLFLHEGWEVAAVDRRLPSAVAGLRLQADASRATDLQRVFGEVAEKWGRLDAVVNNAAEQLCASVLEMVPEDWDRIMASNVRSAYLAAVRAFPLLREARGSIVNVSSVHALATSPGMSAYAASKGALVALTRSLALEFGAAGVRVNAVLPGATDTPMLAAGLSRAALSSGDENNQQRLDALALRHPLRRIGQPAEIARAIYFLADGTWSSFVTGALLVVDGGACAKLSTE